MKALGIGRVQAPEHIRRVWSRAVTFVPYGSGGEQIPAGWLFTAFPFGERGKPVYDSSTPPHPALDAAKQPPQNVDPFDVYGHQDRLGEFYGRRFSDSIPASSFTVPATFHWTEDSERIPVTITSGFLGHETIAVDGSVRPVIGWFVQHAQDVVVERELDENRPEFFN